MSEYSDHVASRSHSRLDVESLGSDGRSGAPDVGPLIVDAGLVDYSEW
jgi:hypothetical protein